MQDEPIRDAHDPYDDFTVDEELMPDGRAIRYYEWLSDIDEQAVDEHV